MDLDPTEIRVLGCLLEKELATPQYYPLTMNALVLACNQASNRDPVVSYSESDVGGAITGLREQGLARIVHSSGQRADKYRQGIGDLLALDAQHRAILCVLLLRGPQTVGELRTRTERLASFYDLDAVEEVLGLLARREEPLAQRVERAPGQKEARWIQLIGPEIRTSATVVEDDGPVAPRADVRAELAALRETVEALQARVEAIESLLD